MSNPLRVALVGAGSIGGLRAKAVAQTADTTLSVVIDIDEDRARNVAQPLHARATSEILTNIQSEDIDLVIISTPHNQHADIAIAALSAGKHVLCEKPLAHSLPDARKMCEVAESNGVYLKTGFNHRYFPSMAYARKLIDEGKIGEVFSVQAYAGHPGGAEFGPGWITDGSVTGGGSLVDNGIHILDLTRFFLDEPIATAKGYISNHIWPFEKAEDNAYALFRTASGRVAQVHASWTQWRGYKFWVEVFGSRGYVRASYPPMLAEWGQTVEPGIRSKKKYEFFPGFQINERLKGWEWTIVESFVEEITLFVKGIRAEKEVPATGRDGLRSMELAHAIYRSSAEGVEVDVSDCR